MMQYLFISFYAKLCTCIKMCRFTLINIINTSLHMTGHNHLTFKCMSLHKSIENNPKQIHTLIGLRPCFYNFINTELAQAVDVTMAGAKRIYILMVKVNMFIFFPLQYFLKEIENMFFMFLLSYRNTCESLGELKKAVETLTCDSCSHSFQIYLWWPINIINPVDKTQFSYSCITLV